MPGIEPTELTIVLLLLFLIVAAFVVVLRNLGGGNRSPGQGERDARQILDERYARGEIGREEYQQMRRDIEG